MSESLKCIVYAVFSLLFGLLYIVGSYSESFAYFFFASGCILVLLGLGSIFLFFAKTIKYRQRVVRLVFGLSWGMIFFGLITPYTIQDIGKDLWSDFLAGILFLFIWVYLPYSFNKEIKQLKQTESKETPST